jgi:hypothetical protein
MTNETPSTERAFSFDDAGRTFTCCVEPTRHDGGRAWWWFAVSTEPHQRHAPFRTADGDTADGVRLRVVAFYDEMRARRDAPFQPHWRRKAPVDAAAAGAAAAPPAPDAPQ